MYAWAEGKSTEKCGIGALLQRIYEALGDSRGVWGEKAKTIAGCDVVS